MNYLHPSFTRSLSCFRIHKREISLFTRAVDVRIPYTADWKNLFRANISKIKNTAPPNIIIRIGRISISSDWISKSVIIDYSMRNSCRSLIVFADEGFVVTPSSVINFVKTSSCLIILSICPTHGIISPRLKSLSHIYCII